MKRQRVLALTVSMVLFASLAVWAGGQGEGEAAQAEMQRKDTLIVDILTGKNAKPRNFNGWAAWVGNDKGWQQLVADPLWTAEYTTGEIINTLASALPVYNDDFTQMTVKLRDNIDWSDGVQFTADDVVFTVEMLKANPGMSYSTEFGLYVEEVYKTDDYTVVFELKKPNSRFHAYFLDRWGACRIAPKHIFEDVEDPMTYDFYPPVSSGPYVLRDYDPQGTWFIYERREDWDRSATGILYGRPKPKFVQFRYYDTPEARVIAQSRHELDMCDLTPESFFVAMNKNEYGRGVYQDFPYAEILHPCVTGATFNCAKEPYTEKDVRWALNLCVDAVEMVMTAYDGSSALCNAFIPATLPFYEWYYEPLQPWLERLTIQVDGKVYEPYDSSIPNKLADAAAKKGRPVPTDQKGINEMFGYGWWKYDPDAASALLEEHGFSRDKNGKWLLPDGSPWKMSIIAHPNPAHPAYKWAFPLAEQYRRFGIDATALITEQRDSINAEGKYDVNTDWPVGAPWGSHPDMYRAFSPYHSELVKPVGERAVGHVSRWSDPRLDAILDEMKTVAFNDEAIIDLTLEATKIIVEEMPGLSLASYPSFIGWDTYYWENYPGGDDPYSQPHYHWPNFKFMLPFLEQTGRE